MKSGTHVAYVAAARVDLLVVQRREDQWGSAPAVSLRPNLVVSETLRANVCFALPSVFVHLLHKLIDSLLALLGPLGVMLSFDLGRVSQNIRHLLVAGARAEQLGGQCMTKTVRSGVSNTGLSKYGC